MMLTCVHFTDYLMYDWKYNHLMLTLHQMTFKRISLLQTNFQSQKKIMKFLLELRHDPVISIIGAKVVRIVVLGQSIPHLDVPIKSTLFNIIFSLPGS